MFLILDINCQRLVNLLRTFLDLSNLKEELYDKYTQSRYFQPGDQVLASSPVPDKPLQAKYFGPYIVKEKVRDLNYIVSTPDRRKNTQLCHINMLKSYVNRDKINVVQCAVPQNWKNVCDTQNSQDFENKNPGLSPLQKSDIRCKLDSKLQRIENSKKQVLEELIYEYKHLFPGVKFQVLHGLI